MKISTLFSILALALCAVIFGVSDPPAVSANTVTPAVQKAEKATKQTPTVAVEKAVKTDIQASFAANTYAIKPEPICFEPKIERTAELMPETPFTDTETPPSNKRNGDGPQRTGGVGKQSSR